MEPTQAATTAEPRDSAPPHPADAEEDQVRLALDIVPAAAGRDVTDGV